MLTTFEVPVYCGHHTILQAASRDRKVVLVTVFVCFTDVSFQSVRGFTEEIITQVQLLLVHWHWGPTNFCKAAQKSSLSEKISVASSLNDHWRPQNHVVVGEFSVHGQLLEVVASWRGCLDDLDRCLKLRAEHTERKFVCLWCVASAE